MYNITLMQFIFHSMFDLYGELHLSHSHLYNIPLLTLIIFPKNQQFTKDMHYNNKNHNI